VNPTLRLIVDAVAADLGSPRDVRPLGADQWANAFVWLDPASLPARRWLYKPHFGRGYVSATVAPGGAGKTTLTICEALSVATGQPLLGITPTERARAWLWNGEDPGDEMQRRVQAAMIHHSLARSDVEGWLFTGSGRDADLVIAEQSRDGARVAVPVIDALIGFIREHDIGLVIIDPFVSSHRVPENDNGAIDRVIKAWAQIAHETRCAVHLVHHTRKTNGQEATVEDGRGASALHAGARHVRALNTMCEAEAVRLGVEQSRRRSYVRVDDGKANLMPPAASAQWFRLVGVELGNGDNVQVAEGWTPPDPFKDVTPGDVRQVQDLVDSGRGDTREGWRADVQAKDGTWVGCAVAEALGLDVSEPRDLARIKELLRSWFDTGDLVRVRRPVNDRGKTAPFVEIGRWVEPATPHLARVGGGEVGEVPQSREPPPPTS